MAAVASATVAIWPASAAEQPAATTQNPGLPQASEPAASAATAGLVAPGTMAVADTAGDAGHTAADKKSAHATAAQQIGGQVLVFKPEFMARQDQRLRLEAERAAAARRARRLAARRRAAVRAAARAAAQAAAAAQRRAARRQPAQAPAAAAPASAQPSGSPQQIAMAMLGSYGWSSSQFGCLDQLWNSESGWDPAAANPSGAYGIPQALPGSKMASAGADWQTDPATQIRWGLGYIKEIYGSPCGAWDHELAVGSY